jgi:hypothetical protein
MPRPIHSNSDSEIVSLFSVNIIAYNYEKSNVFGCKSFFCCDVMSTKNFVAMVVTRVMSSKSFLSMMMVVI